jgi:hypothetical protein
VDTVPQWLAQATGPDGKRPAMYTSWSVASGDPNAYMTTLGSWNLARATSTSPTTRLRRWTA